MDVHDSRVALRLIALKEILAITKGPEVPALLLSPI